MSASLFCGWLSPGHIWPRQKGAGSTAKLNRLEKTDDVALIGDDLRLPDDRHRHQAHHQYADREGHIGVRFGCRKAKCANQPSHEVLLVPVVPRSALGDTPRRVPHSRSNRCSTAAAAYNNEKCGKPGKRSAGCLL